MFDSLSPVSISQIEENSQHAEDLISISNNIIVYDLIKRTKETEKILKGVE